MTLVLQVRDEDDRSSPNEPRHESPPASTTTQFVVILAAITAATAGRWLLDPMLGEHLPYVTYFVVMFFIAWRTDVWPSIVALFLAWWAADFFFVAPRHEWFPGTQSVPHGVATAMYFMVSGTSIVICQAMRSAQRRLAEQGERIRTTLASIGDAVISTDTEGRITSINGVAESLTGWAASEALGQPLSVVFRIVNEKTGQAVENPVMKVLRDGLIVGLANHTVLIARDGTQRPIDDSAAPIRSQNDEVIGCVLVFRDVSQRRREAQILQESEARKTAMFQTALDCIISIDHEGRVLEFNPAAERTFGYRRDDMVGRLLGDLIVPPALREAHRQGMARYLATGESRILNQRQEMPALRADGTEFFAELTVTRIPVDGPPVFTAYLRDITDRRKAEEALRKWEHIFDHAGWAVATAHPETNTLELVNPAFARMHGYSIQELTSRPLADLFAPESRADLAEHVRRSHEQGDYVYESIHVRKDGTKFPLRTHVTAFKDETGRVVYRAATFQDLTEYKQAAEAARKSDERFARFMRHLPGLAWIKDVEGRYVYANAATEAAFGKKRNELYGRTDQELFAPETAAQFVQNDRKALASEAGVQTIETLAHTDGIVHHSIVSKFPIPGNDGEGVMVGGVAFDITEGKHAEEALRRSENDLRDFLENASVGMHWVGPDGAVLWANRAELEMLGYMREEYVGRHIAEFHVDQAVISDILARLTVGKAIVEQPARLRSKDGSVRHVLINSNALFENNQFQHSRCFTLDITARKQAEDKLRESEERFAQFMRCSPGFAWIKDSTGRYVFVNDSVSTALGVDFVGRTDQDLFPPETASQFVENDQRALTSESGIQTIETFPRADGTIHHAIVSKFPIPGPDGQGAMVGGAGFDITEQKRAEDELRESEARFRLLANTVPALIWVNGLEGCEFVNQEYLHFVGRTMQEIQGMNWTTAIHPDDAAVYLAAYLQAFKKTVPFEAQFRFRRADGEYRWMKSAGLPRFGVEGTFLGYVGCSLDITDIKQFEESLAETDRRKNEFLAMLAHELRNPLAPIRNAVEILRLAEGDGEAIQSASEIIERQIGQMIRLVDDLLDVSRISRGKIELRRERVDLASVVNHAIETALPLLENKGLNFTKTLPPEPVFLNADPVRLAQVMGNLLNNARKFTDRGGAIDLTVSVEDEQPDLLGRRAPPETTAPHSRLASPQAVIRVRDTGIGIAADQLPHLFDMFFQVDTSLERRHSGLGIGLTLAKTLVEMHDGTVEVHSDGIGRGSEFVVRVPVIGSDKGRATQKDQSGGEAIDSPTPIKPKRRILVVDDNRDSAESLTVMLELTGSNTRTAYDGLEALDAASAFQPEVILLDIGLPELNGYEVARKIREQPWGEKMVLIALTGWGQDEDRRRSKEAGFDHHVTKPVDPDALMKLLEMKLQVGETLKTATDNAE